MEWKHKLRAVASWSSGRAGLTKSDSAPYAIPFTAAPELGGVEGRWSPEGLLLGALASSLTSTFHALAEKSNLAYADLEVETQATVRKADGGNGYCLGVVSVRPKLVVTHAEDQERAMDLLQKARTLCPVSQALSITPKFEALIEVSQLSLIG